MTPNFNRVARLYRWAEYLTLGPLLQRTRTHFLPQLASCRSALILGDGDGRFLAQLLRQNPTLTATAVDASSEMLALLRQRCAFASGRITTIEADVRNIPLPETDLIVTHFFLDCLTQPEVDALAARLAHPNALWLVSDFQVPAGPMAPFARLYIRALYLAFRILTNLQPTRLPNPAAALETAGFQRIAHHRKLFGLLYTSLWRKDETKDNQSGPTQDDAASNP